MLLIAIDGACRRNGKPDCISAGSAFAVHYDDDLEICKTVTISDYEIGSTNQRGELLALKLALEYIIANNNEANVVTDSEYLFNAMTKNWCSTWAHNGWKTSLGEPVKNMDIWAKIHELYNKLRVEVHFYHIKGHCIPFGAVTASTLLSRDDSGLELLAAALIKYNVSKNGDAGKVSKIDHAQELSLKNNGFMLEEDVLRMFVATNIVADAVATKCVTTANSLFNN